MKLTPFKKLAFVLGASIILQGCVAAVLGGAAAGAKMQQILEQWGRKSMMKH